MDFKKNMGAFQSAGVSSQKFNQQIVDVGASKPAEKRSPKRDSHVLGICIPHMK